MFSRVFFNSKVITFAALALPLLLAPAILSIAVQVFAVCRWDYHFLTIGIVAVLGGIGGALSASQAGTVTFPLFSQEDLQLGLFREVLFGSVGAFIIFLVIPGISEHALKLSEKAIAESGLSRSIEKSVDEEKERGKRDTKEDNKEKGANGNASEKLGAVSDATVKAANSRAVNRTEDKDDLSVDWLELFALALMGGYAGRSIIEKALQQYVTTGELENKTNQVQSDQRAMKYFYDQIDIFTSAPNVDELVAAIRKASPATHEAIYTQTRNRCHLYMHLASLEQSVESRLRLKRRIAERIIPLMAVLRDLDTEQRFRGSRFLLAVAYYTLQDIEKAKQYLSEAVAISNRMGQPLSSQYIMLEQRLAAGIRCDEEFLHAMIGSET